MNKLRPTIKLALFISVASLFFAACSDDDDKKYSRTGTFTDDYRNKSA